MNNLSILSLTISLLVLSWSTVASPLTTIYDSGDTLSIKDYQQDSYQQHDQYGNEERPKSFIDSNAALAQQFPITTPTMTPKIIEAIELSVPYLQVPLFIIGNDHLSKHWLSLRRQELIRIGAVGMLVEAKSSEEVESIKQLGEGLQIYPASGRDIATQLGLEHYPVLISRNGIEQ